MSRISWASLSTCDTSNGGTNRATQRRPTGFATVIIATFSQALIMIATPRLGPREERGERRRVSVEQARSAHRVRMREPRVHRRERADVEGDVAATASF